MTQVVAAFLDRAAVEADPALVDAFARTYVGEWNKGVRYLEDAHDLVRRLAERFGLAIITNTHDPELVPGHLERMGVASLFEAVVTSVELGIRKPGRGIFEHALGRLAAAPERCIYVGDSFEADYVGARSAGIPSLLIDPEATTPANAGDRLQSILDLERVLGP
jgi:putative hydrolase of the HAD superfamily